MNNTESLLTHIPYFWLFLTIAIYKLSIKIKSFKYLSKVPPVILASIIIYALLSNLTIKFEDYDKTAGILTFMLFPATIALAFPLIENIKLIKTNKRAISIGVLGATTISIIGVIIISKLLDATQSIMLSLIPKSITTPIAIEVSKNIGGIPELTTCIVIFTGLFGGLIGHRLLKKLNIKHDLSIGIAIGAASHVMGTSRCIEKNNPKQAAASALTLILVAICTAILAPILLKILI